MDKFNIIEPKDSLAALDLEMNQWLQLPTDFKFISNDDCIRLHGCTVPEYYNRLKLMLMNAEDDAGALANRSNLIKESIDWFTPEYNDKVKQSLQVMVNPYIVIIIPGSQDVDSTYSNYLNLNSKNRRLSDYYSMEIWGVNVRNMFELLKAEETDEPEHEPSNLKLVGQIESVLYAIYDKWNKAKLENNETELRNVNEILKNLKKDLPGSRQSLITEISKSIFNSEDPDKLYLPRYCPWFTLEEMAYMGIDSNIFENFENNSFKDAIDQMFVNGDDDGMLDLGWNPNLVPNKYAFTKAKERQAEFLNHKFDIEKHNDIRVKLDNNKLYIAFPGNLDKTYTPWFNNKGTFIGFSQAPNIYTNKDMMVAKMDPKLYKNLEKKCKQFECPDKSEYGYNCGLKQMLLNPVNPLDLDFERVKEACVIDTLYKLSTVGLENVAYPSITF